MPPHDWNHKCKISQCDGFSCIFKREKEVPLRKIKSLGGGGFGYVDEVKDLARRRYARKFIGYRLNCDVNMEQDNAQQEVDMMRKLDHHHIVKLVGCYEQQKSHRRGLLMAPVAENDLHGYLEDLDHLDVAALWNGFGCLAATLIYVHGLRIIHEDIKPQNILIHNNRLLFADFGLAKDFTDRTNSLSCTARGWTVNVSADQSLYNVDTLTECR